jgi:hypothetical protein
MLSARSIFLICVALLTGCVSIDKDTLPDQSPTQELQIEDFAGTYVLTENTAADFGLFRLGKERFTGETLTLQSSPSALTATYRFANSTTESAVIDLASKDTRFRDGRLSYRLPRFEGMKFGIAYAERNCFMYLDRSGDLAVVASGRSTGMAFMIIPAHNNYRAVYRFRRIE